MLIMMHFKKSKPLKQFVSFRLLSWDVWS